MSGAPLPIAVLGGGPAAMRQALAAAECPDVELTAVVDPAGPDCSRAAEAGFPVVRELEEAPQRTRAAVVALTNSARRSAAEAVIERGWAVLFDGGVADTLRDARLVIAAAQQAGAPLLVGHDRRHHPAAAAAREAVQAGLLGRLVAVDALWALRRPVMSSAYAWRVASGGAPGPGGLIHELDLLRWLAGEICEIVAMSARAAPEAAEEDAAAALLRFECGALGTAMVSDSALSPWGWEAGTGERADVAGSGQDSLRLMGSEGALSLPSLAYWRHGGEGGGDRSSTLTRLNLPCPPVDPLVAQLAHFARVAAGDAAPVASGEDGLRSLAAALAAQESCRASRPVRPDPERPDAWEPTAAAIYRDLSGQER